MEMSARNITELYPELLALLLFKGRRINSRGMDVLEITNFTFTLQDVARPLVLQEKRKLNYAYAVLEPFLLTMPQTYATVEACKFYAGKFLGENVIDPRTEKMHGFYGDRINWNGRNQLLEIFEILKEDPGSRRAVMTIHDSKQELFSDYESLDTPCTLELQFMIRRGQLDCFVNMRGNDAMLGTPQNVPMWTFFQRMLAYWLQVPTGQYIHHVNSMHLYKRDVEKAEDIVRYSGNLAEEYQIPLTWEISNPLTSLKMCEKFVENERSYRETGKTKHEMPSFLGILFGTFIKPKIYSKKQQAMKRMGNPYASLRRNDS